MVKSLAASFLVVFCNLLTSAQSLVPGFSKTEYINLMKVSAQFGDSVYAAAIPPPTGYRLIYPSPVVGLQNRWQLWMTDKGIPVISIRGTTRDETSWLANFYAAMVPAKGELQLSATEKFRYELATNPRAAVHVGWLVSTGFLVKDIMPKLDSLYRANHKELLIVGHSQGGGIGYLLTAYLYNLQRQKGLPADMRFKTYCSAGPKPGNLYFAYDYEAMTQAGWAYNVVNSTDWVPESPVSIQTSADFNNINPFANAKGVIRKQGFFKRLALNYAYRKLTRNNEKAVHNYQRFLGGYVVRSVKKQLPGFVEPEYANTNNYARTGNTITLVPDSAYYQLYKQEKDRVFVNHFHAPYLYLAERLSMPGADDSTGGQLSGSWLLRNITDSKVSMDSLYQNRKPLLIINQETGTIKGNTGCNSLSGKVDVSANSIRVGAPLATTRMFCPGQGEQTFLAALRKVNRFAIAGQVLTLLADDVTVMQLVRQ
ncbi:META domain-containing protein [Segetibacter sp. 3557_3]|uniref:META domain-containing protein n=1 Tax=Segetibacter sp. 3557_3 TaxID=2547429 RepID=UPI0010585190|nr:META domain-containing protein [Segetibacter sp. 3557_3]TDH21662.1 META domain-containing protein [Segetibacter sp. 3557_3]